MQCSAVRAFAFVTRLTSLPSDALSSPQAHLVIVSSGGSGQNDGDEEMMSLKRSYAQASAPSPSPNVTSLAPPPVNTAVVTASASASATSASASLTATLTPPAASTATSSSSLLPPNLITDPSLTLSLQRYLQRRQYHPSCPEKTLSVQEFALKSVLGNEASGSDAVGFTCVSADAAHVDQQYSKFKVSIPKQVTIIN